VGDVLEHRALVYHQFPARDVIRQRIRRIRRGVGGVFVFEHGHVADVVFLAQLPDFVDLVLLGVFQAFGEVVDLLLEDQILFLQHGQLDLVVHVAFVVFFVAEFGARGGDWNVFLALAFLLLGVGKSVRWIVHGFVEFFFQCLDFVVLLVDQFLRLDLEFELAFEVADPVVHLGLLEVVVLRHFAEHVVFALELVDVDALEFELELLDLVFVVADHLAEFGLLFALVFVVVDRLDQVFVQELVFVLEFLEVVDADGLAPDDEVVDAAFVEVDGFVAHEGLVVGAQQLLLQLRVALELLLELRAQLLDFLLVELLLAGQNFIFALLAFDERLQTLHLLAQLEFSLEFLEFVLVGGQLAVLLELLVLLVELVERALVVGHLLDVLLVLAFHVEHLGFVLFQVLLDVGELAVLVADDLGLLALGIQLPALGLQEVDVFVARVVEFARLLQLALEEADLVLEDFVDVFDAVDLLVGVLEGQALLVDELVGFGQLVLALLDGLVLGVERAAVLVELLLDLLEFAGDLEAAALRLVQAELQVGVLDFLLREVVVATLVVLVLVLVLVAGFVHFLDANVVLVFELFAVLGVGLPTFGDGGVFVVDIIVVA